MGNTVVFTKLCNAFLPNAKVNPETVPSAAFDAVERYHRRHGGIWVGGKIIVRDDEIQFLPNGVNVALHTNARPLLVPFEWIRTVEWQFGVLTGIVVVRCADFDFRFRCFGAKQVVKRLSSLIKPN